MRTPLRDDSRLSIGVRETGYRSSEQLADESKETAAGFWKRASAFFAAAGISVRAVMTDNGACYRSHAFANALGEGVKHRRTRPYRPQTNGRVCEHLWWCCTGPV